jgi:hypothetical protein
MAVIECVFTYDAKNQKVLQEVHVLELEASDKLTLVTHQPDLILQAEHDFKLMNLEKDDFAPIKYTTVVRPTNVPKFAVYYHGDQGKMACGHLVAAKATAASAPATPATTGYGNSQFQAWPKAAGQTVPDGGPGG